MLVFCSTDRLPGEPGLEVTKSGLPSWLKSATATDSGPAPTPKLVAAPKLPVPLPSRIDKLAELRLATVRSGIPSRLKSPTAIERGLVPAAKLVAAPKPPAPLPSRIDTLLESLLPVATS